MGNSNNKIERGALVPAFKGSQPCKTRVAQRTAVAPPYPFDRPSLNGGNKPALSTEQVVNIALAALKQIEAYLLSTGMLSPDKLSEMEQMMLAKLHGILEAEGPQGIKNYLDKSPYKSSFEDLVKALDTHVHDAANTGQSRDEEDAAETAHNESESEDDNTAEDINTSSEQQTIEEDVTPSHIAKTKARINPADQGYEGTIRADIASQRTSKHVTSMETLVGGNSFTQMIGSGIHTFLNNKFIRALVDLFFVLSILTFYFQPKTRSN